jgi:two-component system chemotaxis response regulator CheY
MFHFKILLIENEDGLRSQHRAELERDGYRVLESDSSVHGLEMLETDSPDLVIIDPDDPTMDGSEAVNRALAHCPRIPVLLSTDIARTDDPLATLADAMVSRSAEPARLRDEVRRMLAPRL